MESKKPPKPAPKPSSSLAAPSAITTSSPPATVSVSPWSLPAFATSCTESRGRFLLGLLSRQLSEALGFWKGELTRRFRHRRFGNDAAVEEMNRAIGET